MAKRRKKSQRETPAERRYMRLFTHRGAEFSAWLEEFQKESDRACGVLAAAFLDSLLGDLLKRYCRDDPNARGFIQQRDLWSRIELTFALGLISKLEQDDLHLIRSVRNEFAHKLVGTSF